MLLLIPSEVRSAGGTTTDAIALEAPKTALGATERIESQIRASMPEIMVRVAYAESQLDPYAKNDSSSAKGIFQILDGTWSWYNCDGNVLDAADNIACAAKIYKAEGTKPWEASKSVWDE